MQDPTTHIKETVLCTASDNVDSHAMLAAVESCAVSSTEAACLSAHKLLDWREYRDVAL